MKKLLVAALLALSCTGAFADNLQTLVYNVAPKMTCQNCENKIKKNIRFVKGTKTIETNLKENTVTIVYDADKAKPSDYVAAFKKIGREATEAKEAKK